MSDNERIELVAKALYEGEHPVYPYRLADDLKKAQCRSTARHVLAALAPLHEHDLREARREGARGIVEFFLDETANLEKPEVGWATMGESPTYGDHRKIWRSESFKQWVTLRRDKFLAKGPDAEQEPPR